MLQEDQAKVLPIAGWNGAAQAGGPRTGYLVSESAGPQDEIAVSIILPAFNEAAALPSVLETLLPLLGAGSEVIVVDDGSTDATALIARRFPCRLLRHKQNYGKGAAVRTGLLEARGRFIIVMDADGTYPAEAIPAMIELAADHDFVRCVRADGVTNSPRVNRVGNKLFDQLLKLVHGLEGGDHLSGLYGLSREALEAMRFTAERFDLEIEIGIKARARRLRSATLPITYASRLGEKKLHPWRDGFSILRRILSLALVYNPGLTFVLPGVLLGTLTMVMTIVLSQGNIRTPYVSKLDINSFIVAAIGMTIGFQLIVFGIVAALYGAQMGASPGRWLRTLSHAGVRFGAAALGLLFAVVGLGKLTSLIVAWVSRGGGTFGNTRSLVLSEVLLSWGVQIILAAMFISIFAGRLDAEGQTEAWSARLVEVEDPTVGEDLDPSPGPLLRTAAQPADEIQAAGYARRLAEAQPGAVDR